MSSGRRWSPGAGHQETDDPTRTATERVTTLRALHRPGDPLIVPNVWDAASACAVEAAGFPAVATSSAAIAESLGHADGEATPVDEMLDAIARIAAAVAVPVTADLERGYRMGPAELVERLVSTGAVGCNLEDSDPSTDTMVDPNQQADVLSAVRAATIRAGADLVINARVDSYLHGSGPPEQRLADAVRRARLYLQADVDCVYPILATDGHAIGSLVEQAGGPVNILFRTASPPMPSLAELAELGVARISFGSGLFRSMQAQLASMLTMISAGDDPYPHRG